MEGENREDWTILLWYLHESSIYSEIQWFEKQTSNDI